MSTMVAAHDARTPSASPSRPPTTVLLTALAVVVLRLPSLNGWLAKDEAGYLDVAKHWHAGGSSLYGNYWVDRPPLLITIFRAAALLGGTIPLRLIGIGAAVITVLAVAHAAQILAGPRAATCAALTAATFLLSPLTGAFEVNGELLAAPFIAIGIAATITMLTTDSTRCALSASILAGATGLLAVLVKQNMLDVFVFTSILTLLQARRLNTRRSALIIGGFLSGAALAFTTMATWTITHGTSLPGVWFAMYRFRIEAHTVMAAGHGDGSALRGDALLRYAAASGMVLVAALILLTAVNTLRARPHHPCGTPASALAQVAPLALVATLTYDVTSIYLGGSYWSHYLVQLTAPLALGAGLATTNRPRTSALVISALIISTTGAMITFGLHPTAPGGNPLGADIAATAHPGDTIVTLWAQPQVTHASGLTSPYPYLWFLPEQTLDPQIRLLATTLAGAHSPTWIVTWAATTLPGVDTSAVTTILQHNYHQVAHHDGHTIYLHNGTHRATPTTR